MSNGAEFSGAVRLAGVDDFIAPSQDCVLPITKKKQNSLKLDSSQGPDSALVDAPSVRISGRNRGKPEIPETKTVRISLNDCLACSGCITTAESILVQQQSSLQLREALERCSTKGDPNLVAVTVSPQSLASLAAKHGLGSELAATRAVVGYFLASYRHLPRLVVLNASFARQFSLLAAVGEFETVWKDRNRDGRSGRLPLISSVCPGWVCYAEKTHADLLIPHLSRVRSPQVRWREHF